MLCPRCYGSHTLLINGQPRPCPECSGMGEIHCCDGLQEQPDADADVPEPSHCRVPPPNLGLPSDPTG